MRTVMAVAAILFFAANCLAVTPSQQKAEREALVSDDQGGGTSQEKAVLTWAGEIVSIKKSFNQVTVEDQKTLTEKIFTVRPEDLKSVKLGDNVEVKYKDGSNIAESITAAKPSPFR